VPWLVVYSSKLNGKKYLPASLESYSSKDGAQEASHEAIRPSDVKVAKPKLPTLIGMLNAYIH
jgi:DNA topoisomerase IA